ncbi:hypothetical protein KKD37_00365 [Patescibacteria group bacterium]|nr:hypothetical protein [Patescibacteria group bacterium]
MTERIFKTVGKNGIECDQPCFAVDGKDALSTSGYAVQTIGLNSSQRFRFICTATGAPLIKDKNSSVRGEEKPGENRTCQLVEEALAKMTE